MRFITAKHVKSSKPVHLSTRISTGSNPPTAVVDNSVITLLIHTCIHPRLMKYVKYTYACYRLQRHFNTSLLSYDIQSMGQN